ncbi:MAG: Lytic transglycosylase [Candidatus Tokpelaia hoelldobleri]|uniref:Lytic transglycosylase n=1 Tax=Candidatus Tokpelaia hoelldobleri TaxID=1902579 RepID=A0A1U9JSF6_9HYPH|nr:MAG: Lytic transglycosylase [Candidatus Tokpelaia hoelldoblerii]
MEQNGYGGMQEQDIRQEQNKGTAWTLGIPDDKLPVPIPKPVNVPRKINQGRYKPYEDNSWKQIDVDRNAKVFKYRDMSVYEPIRAVAERYNLDSRTLEAIAYVESSGRPWIENNLGYKGLFQFADRTGADYGLTPEDAFDPYKASDAAARFMIDNANHIRRVIGRYPTQPELYLAHQQGMGNAAKLLKYPDQSARKLLQHPGKPNVNGYLSNFPKDIAIEMGYIKTDKDPIPDLTARQFAEMWEKKFNRLYYTGGW